MSNRPWWYHPLPRIVKRRLNRARQCPATDQPDGGFCCQRWQHEDPWHVDFRGREWRDGSFRAPGRDGGRPCSDCCHTGMQLPEGAERLTENWVCASCSASSDWHFRAVACETG